MRVASLLVALAFCAVVLGQPFSLFPPQVNYVNNIYIQTTFLPDRNPNTAITRTNVFKYDYDRAAGKTQLYVEWQRLFNGGNYSGESWSFFDTKNRTGVIYVSGTGNSCFKFPEKENVACSEWSNSNGLWRSVCKNIVGGLFTKVATLDAAGAFLGLNVSETYPDGATGTLDVYKRKEASAGPRPQPSEFALPPECRKL